MKIFNITNILLISSIFLSLGCASGGAKSAKLNTPVYYAVAEVRSTKGHSAKGVVKFAEGFGSVRITGEISGLDKNSKHGFHIHEYGDCSAADASSAGGHYNPAEHPHGNITDEARHAGDLGNLITDAKGVAKFEIEVRGMSINGEINPVIGRGLIVHKGMDDYISQPTGGAGARIACGVIGAASRPEVKQ